MVAVAAPLPPKMGPKGAGAYTAGTSNLV